jgi:hypothetical protein
MRNFFALGIVAVLLFGFSNDTNQVESKVIKAASEGLATFLGNIPQGSESQFGFNDRSEIMAATIATPYRLLTLSTEFYNGRSLTSTNYKTFITETNEWRVPVLVNGESRLLLTIVPEGKEFTAADLGGAKLAGEIGQLVQNNGEHRYYLLKIHRLTAEFLLDAPTGNLDRAKCMPLSSAREALPALADSKTVFSVPEVLQVVRKELGARPSN